MARRRRYRLHHGGRARGWADDVELMVARVVGRDLRWWEGLLVQLAAIAVVVLAAYWLFASGTVAEIASMFGQYMGDNLSRSLSSPAP